MVSVALGFASLLGLLNVLLAIYVLFASIASVVNRRRHINQLGMGLYLIQAVFVPVALLLSGGILFFQGWRLDPILQFAYLLIVMTIVYLTIKDALIMSRR